MPGIKSHEAFLPGSLRTGGFQIEFEYLCIRCGGKFKERTGTAKRCVECRKIHKKEWHRKYHKKYVKKKKVSGAR